MQIGKTGKVDAVAERTVLETGADVCVVLVLGGSVRRGLSLAAKDPEWHRRMPELLRLMADDIEKGAGPSGVRVTPLPSSHDS